MSTQYSQGGETVTGAGGGYKTADAASDTGETFSRTSFYIDDFSKGRERVGLSGEGGRSGRRGYSLGSGGSNGISLLAGITIGAALMYLFDPEQGRRRRALLRDQIVSCMNETGDILGKTSRDLRNRAQGVIAETGKTLGLRGERGEASDTSGGAMSQSTAQGSGAGA